MGRAGPWGQIDIPHEGKLQARDFVLQLYKLNVSGSARFEVLTAVFLKIQVFLDAMPC
jgi:hypothetical protein